MNKVRITYRKSMIGYSRDQKATMFSLGLRRLHQSVVRPDSPSLRGMLFKVRHMVEVEAVDEAAEVASAAGTAAAASPQPEGEE